MQGSQPRSSRGGSRGLLSSPLYSLLSLTSPGFEPHRVGARLAVIGACRRLGITHIIEEGRYGGLSALVTPAPIPTP